MRSYCRLKTGLAGFLLFYLVMALLGLLFSPNKEIFPFYSWFLFSAVPNPGYHYGILISEHDGQSYDPPVSYEKIEGVTANPQLITTYQFIQKMGRIHDSGDQAQFSEFSELFQRNFLRGTNSYQLIKTYYDPVEKWHGKKSDPEVLQTFSKVRSKP